MRTAWLVLLFVPLAAGQATEVPGIQDAVTDGAPFELDTPETLARLQAVADDISGQRVHDCVERITMDVPFSYRLMGTPTQSAFVSRYENVFADLGLPSALHNFDEGGAGIGVNLGTGGTNILGVLPGKQLDKWVVLGGHYDTREGTIGALDNTSGICTVLELARAMKADTDKNGAYEASVVFAWYDGEEWGLYGAIAFSEDPSVANELLGREPDAPVDFLVSQSFDMPGINYPAMNIWPRCYDGPDPCPNLEKRAVLNLRTAPIHVENQWTCWSYGCYEGLKEREDFPERLRNFTNYQFLVRETAYDFLQYPPDMVWVYDDHYGRSDHIPLIGRQAAAGMRIQGAHDQEYPCYHQPCDTLPWLYTQVGGRDLLIEAYDVEATVGGVVPTYVALFADHGAYGDKYWLNETVRAAYYPGGEVPVRGETPSTSQPTTTAGDRDTPALPVALLAIALLALARRRA